MIPLVTTLKSEREVRERINHLLAMHSITLIVLHDDTLMVLYGVAFETMAWYSRHHLVWYGIVSAAAQPSIRDSYPSVSGNAL